RSAKGKKNTKYTLFSEQTPAQPIKQAALKRPFCFATMPDKHKRLPHHADGAAPPNRRRQSLQGPANKRIRAATIAQYNPTLGESRMQR
ncbi:hypothetical protein, partial [Pararhizobium sp. DWP1-1-3]|uniref:hypothetical protein n=1 Tax=Pararhizobium sp. DWP1-1-3 TaxID=2804652 RepID=UPI003CEC9200